MNEISSLFFKKYVDIIVVLVYTMYIHLKGVNDYDNKFTKVGK